MELINLSPVCVQVWYSHPQGRSRQYQDLEVCFSLERGSLILKQFPTLYPNSSSFVGYEIVVSTISSISSSILSTDLHIISFRVNEQVGAAMFIENHNEMSRTNEEAVTLEMCCSLAGTTIAEASQIDIVIPQASDNKEATSLLLDVLRQHSTMNIAHDFDSHVRSQKANILSDPFILDDNAVNFLCGQRHDGVLPRGNMLQESNNTIKILPPPYHDTKHFTKQNHITRRFRHIKASRFRYVVEPEDYAQGIEEVKKMQLQKSERQDEEQKSLWKMKSYGLPRGSTTPHVRTATSKAESQEAWKSFALSNGQQNGHHAQILHRQPAMRVPWSGSNSSGSTTTSLYSPMNDTGGYLADPRRDFNKPEYETGVGLRTNTTAVKRRKGARSLRCNPPIGPSGWQNNSHANALAKHGNIW